eukprot:12288322-Heterocapsa_arctica.AAC.1
MLVEFIWKPYASMLKSNVEHLLLLSDLLNLTTADSSPPSLFQHPGASLRRCRRSGSGASRRSPSPGC